MYPDWKNRVAAEAPGAAATRGGSGLDLRQMLGRGPQEDEDARRLSLTVFSQPALFVIEYALARLWMRWGISPQSLIGYSIGEYVAACLSGVFSLEDALMLVARRARMIQELPGGAMLAVSLPAEEVEPLLGRHLSISAINGPHVCVVSGATEAADELEEDLTRRGVVARRLQATHAFHSGMMEPIVEPFTELVGTVKLNPPNVPLISNVTGTWLTPAQATDPRYWATHLSQPVRFGDGIQELWRVPGRVLLEVGPGQALGAWAMQHPQSAQVEGRVILSSLRHSYDRQSDQSFLLNTLGRLWQAGLQVNWTEFYAGERRRRVPLPSYPFERQRYWVEPPRQERDSPREARPATLNKKNYIADWFYLPIWKQSKPPAASARADSADGAARRYLVFVDEAGVGARLVEQLKQAGRDVLTVRAGERFDKLDENTFVVNPGRGQDFGDLFGQLKQRQRFPQVICHMWGVTPPQDGHGAGVELAERHQEVCFYSLLSLAQALGDHGFNNPLRLMVVTDGVHSIGGAEAVYPAKALTLGPCRVIPQEYPHIDCQSVDVVVPQAGTRQAEILTSQLLAELAADASDATVAYRGSHRWLQTFEPIRLDEAPGEKTLLREKGVYLITGGVGGIGLTLAEHLARTARARLVLTGRSAFPQRSEWASWLAARGADDEVSRKIKKLQELESLGAEVLVLDADVTSQTQMERVVSQTHERFGKIDGVIHAAGVAPGGMIQLKTPEAAARVLAPKVRGTLVLDAVLKNEQPDFLILCSSLNAFVGALGLVDHCAANAFLDAYAESSATHNRTHTVSINWDGWLDVGQAAHASLSKGLRQILEAAHSAAGAHPLLDKLLVDEPEQKIHSTELSAGRHWVLAEHRLLGDSVLPGTGYIEMVRAAFAAHAGDKTIHMRKVFFLTPLILKGSEVKEVRIIFTKNEEGFSFRVISRAAGAAAAEAPWQEHAKGRIASLDDDSAGEFPLAETLARLNPQELEVIKAERIKLRAETSAPEPEAEFKDFGPRWQNLVRRIGVGDGEAIAYLELPEEFVDDLQTLGLHPALMDAATGFVQIAGEGSYLPLAYESIKIRAPLPKHLYSYAKFGGTSAGRKDVLVSDLVITDVHGNRLIEIGEYTLKRVTSPAVFGAAADNGSAGADTTHATAPPETRKHEGPSAHVETGTSVIAEGILPKEGAEAFGRILRSGLSVARIAVATRELGALIERSRAQNSESILEEVNNLQPLRQKHARPNLAVAYAAPRTEVEKKLAHIWRELLAVEEVGVHDSFFDMGGDSLLATMLIGRVSEALNVDLPLRTLFAAPTVAELALAITQKQAEQVDSDALMELLTNIKNLSKDEVKAMLSAEKQGNG
ncbi:MAG TPA: SDR family NAD(P)-dependent oxidoreductase [Pyrinomonadaceae bacterium]|jgi:malonyl CoA-acyl carrier protein transacylase/acyl carrier protein